MYPAVSVSRIYQFDIDLVPELQLCYCLYATGRVKTSVVVVISPKRCYWSVVHHDSGVDFAAGLGHEVHGHNIRAAYCTDEHPRVVVVVVRDVSDFRVKGQDYVFRRAEMFRPDGGHCSL